MDAPLLTEQEFNAIARALASLGWVIVEDSEDTVTGETGTEIIVTLTLARGTSDKEEHDAR